MMCMLKSDPTELGYPQGPCWTLRTSAEPSMFNLLAKLSLPTSRGSSKGRTWHGQSCKVYYKNFKYMQVHGGMQGYYGVFGSNTHLLSY